MPLAVQVLSEEELIWVTGEGHVSDEDLAAYVREFLVDRGLKEFDEVFDLSRADLLDLTYEGLSRVAAAAAPTDPAHAPTRISILVSEALGLGISRMYQSLREGRGGRRNLRIFWDLSELLEWMELPGDLSVLVRESRFSLLEGDAKRAFRRYLGARKCTPSTGGDRSPGKPERT